MEFTNDNLKEMDIFIEYDNGEETGNQVNTILTFYIEEILTFWGGTQKSNHRAQRVVALQF
jgi:hypothetical protein